MKKYDYILLGPAKTGTTSLFFTLSQHSQICPSKIKETMNQKEFNPNKYLDLFKVNKNTKYLLEGTPAPYRTDNRFEKHRKNQFDKVISQGWVNKIKIIYPIRNPFKRLVSLMRLVSYTHDVVPEARNWFYSWFDDQKNVVPKLAFNEIKKNFIDSYSLQRAMEITNDIHIQKLETIDIQKILEFLDLKIENFEFLRRNVGPPLTSDLDRNILWFINKNIHYLKEIFIGDLEIVQKDFNVDLSGVISEVQKTKIILAQK